MTGSSISGVRPAEFQSPRGGAQVAALERVDKKLDTLQGMDRKLQAVNGQLSTTNAPFRATAEKITHATLLS